MSDIQIGFVGIAALLFLLSLRIPVAFALIGVSFGGLWSLFGWPISWGALSLIPYNFAANWLLSAVPMFLLLGYICFHMDLTQGLFRAARLWLAAMPGGLAIAAILGSAGFAAVCGSSVACSAAMGRIAVPEMLKHRYHPELATGTVAIAGTIGALIPPSIIMILYGVITQTPITGLFLGGISAGVLSAIGYIAVVVVRVKLNPSLAPQHNEGFTRLERLAALTEIWPLLLIMIGIFGGLFGGVFTPTEAGAVGASLATLVAIAKGTFSMERFRAAISEALLTTSTLIIIAIGASLFTRFLTLSGTGVFISEVIVNADADITLVMVGIVIVYLLLGMFLEPIGAMLLTLPIVLPIIESNGLSLLWFGVILTKMLEIGMVTPPIGMNVFVIKSVVGDSVPMMSIFRGVFYFVLIDLIILAVIMIFPDLILFLPGIFE